MGFRRVNPAASLKRRGGYDRRTQLRQRIVFPPGKSGGLIEALSILVGKRLRAVDLVSAG